ncbi:hypothetical protein F511_20015 [Dorcoceras hygrometricum]|uniref:Uncharacterized protein n=1 Tax=Dorcoceras hygrometricum TaxID=472368 RepID=A0A2Z7DDY6_9LAMI|nr:hypothetical protein F511_20015 [Dorcoceras hygrometricum]
MPFPMKVQPIDCSESSIGNDAVVKTPVLKSRLKRLFDRPFNSVMRISTVDRPAACIVAAEFEPSSVCLDKMVQNFIEENNDKPTGGSVAMKCGRNRCNCFNGNSNDSSDDELDVFSDSLAANSAFGDSSDALKSLTPCASMVERNLLADTSRIVEKNKTCRRKYDLRKIVADGLIALGYNASVCKSKWEKSPSIPAGDYEYVDVILDGERVIIDIDFRSEFEIARSTINYKAILQYLPNIFVGNSDRLLQIVSIASEAARQSLKKKGMHIAPWRKSEYMKSKWLGPYTRIPQPKVTTVLQNDEAQECDESMPEPELVPEPEVVTESEVGELDLIFGEKSSSFEADFESPKPPEKSDDVSPVVVWQLPAVKPRSLERGNKAVITGLASLLSEKN